MWIFFWSVSQVMFIRLSVHKKICLIRKQYTTWKIFVNFSYIEKQYAHLNRSFVRPHGFSFWENWVIATMAITKGKCIVSHISPCFYCAWAASYIRCFPSKQHEFWTHVILLLGFDFGFDCKESTETHSDLNRSPSSENRHITTCVMQCSFNIVGTYKNKTSPKIT
jgi:hypothetical protein